MRFKNDNQRKALFARLANLGNPSQRSCDGFANINKFATIPKAFDYPVSGVALSSYLPEEEFVAGYTGSKIYPNVMEEKSPIVVLDNVPIEADETAILAGEHYKGSSGIEGARSKARSEYLIGEPVFSDDRSKIVKMQTPIGTMEAKEDFAKEMENTTVKRIPRKKGIVELIEEEGGTPDRLSLKSLDEIKREFDVLWDEDESHIAKDKKSMAFLLKASKSKRPEISGWANKHLKEIHNSKMVELQEMKAEDPSKGTDPDYFKSEDEMNAELEAEDEDRRSARYLD